MKRPSTTKIFPDIETHTARFKEGYSILDIWTRTRCKNDKGKWYLSYVYNQYQIEEGKSTDIAISQFIANCYKSILFGLASEDVINLEGDPIFELDPNQESEEIRIINTIKIQL
jgi:hypothetical protein